MQQTKTIKIFLGSSIVELHDERVILGDYIMNSVRPIFKNDGIEIELIKCEDIHSGNSGPTSQEVIDNRIRECDLSLFLFKSQAGENTLHEFDVARSVQNTKHHEIYLYCFDVPEERKSEDLKTFQNRLEKEKLYWKTCKDIDSLESQFIIGLLQFERQLLGMKPTSTVEQESDIEKDGDTLFEEYELNKQKLHQKIDELLQQTKTVMENEDDTIAAKIFKVIELYKKADRWAAATAYDKEKYYNLLSAYARFLYDYGLYKDAESIYLRQIPLAEELYGAEHEKTATSYNNIGAVYKKQGDYDNALEYYQKALGIYEKVLGTEHSYTATSYNNIGLVYDEQGNYGKALEYHQKALAIREKVLGTEHPSTATSYHDIGGVYDAQGDYGKALEYYQKALAIREKVLGTEHPDTAQSYNNIGLVYWEQGDYGKALEYYKKALAIKEKVLGAEHPSTAGSYNNIGGVYREQGDYGKALEYYKKALEIVEKVLGTEHPDTATTYNNIGGVYYAQGDYDKALEYYQKALEIVEKVLGTEHPYTASSYNNIGLVYDEQGDYGKALEYYQKALAIREKVLGTEHPDTATSYNNIGWVYREQGDYKTALDYYDKAYKIRKEKLGDEHPDTKDVLLSIKIVKQAMNANGETKKGFFRRLFGK